MTQIINEIDALSSTHKVLAGDSNYRPEAADEPQFDENGNPKPRPNRDKKPKIYPNLGVETTVLGDYSNLRRFLSDLERSNQFLIVNSLTFQGGDDRIARQLAKEREAASIEQRGIRPRLTQNRIRHLLQTSGGRRRDRNHRWRRQKNAR